MLGLAQEHRIMVQGVIGSMEQLKGGAFLVIGIDCFVFLGDRIEFGAHLLLPPYCSPQQLQSPRACCLVSAAFFFLCFFNLCNKCKFSLVLYCFFFFGFSILSLCFAFLLIIIWLTREGKDGFLVAFRFFWIYGMVEVCHLLISVLRFAAWIGLQSLCVSLPSSSF